MKGSDTAADAGVCKDTKVATYAGTSAKCPAAKCSRLGNCKACARNNDCAWCKTDKKCVLFADVGTQCTVAGGFAVTAKTC